MDKNTKIDEAFQEYVELRYKGVSHETAMKTFDYMHPIQLSRLEKRIKESFREEKSEAV